eukprot:TRINITY_DN1901_c0_g1_i1.p1 TRINITY_DN1901_c0_g1~~TRINITY_DN1901_c0_g1_i1.p1  ORF type:complete len:512 (+),score=98.44 TRINITY_DN1901_c0_g1_i1:99-1634(+)
MIRRPPRSTHCISSAASDVYKRQLMNLTKQIMTTPQFLPRSSSLKQIQEKNFIQIQDQGKISHHLYAYYVDSKKQTSQQNYLVSPRQISPSHASTINIQDGKFKGSPINNTYSRSKTPVSSSNNTYSLLKPIIVACDGDNTTTGKSTSNIEQPNQPIHLSSQSPTQQSNQNLKQSKQQSTQQLLQQSEQQSVQQSVEQSVQQTVQQTAQQNVQQTVQQNVQQTVPQTAQQPVKQQNQQLEKTPQNEVSHNSQIDEESNKIRKSQTVNLINELEKMNLAYKELSIKYEVQSKQVTDLQEKIKGSQKENEDIKQLWEKSLKSKETNSNQQYQQLSQFEQLQQEIGAWKLKYQQLEVKASESLWNENTQKIIKQLESKISTLVEENHELVQAKSTLQQNIWSLRNNESDKVQEKTQVINSLNQKIMDVELKLFNATDEKMKISDVIQKELDYLQLEDSVIQGNTIKQASGISNSLQTSATKGNSNENSKNCHLRQNQICSPEIQRQHLAQKSIF